MTIKPVILRRRAEGDVEEAVEHYLAGAGEEVALRFIDALQAVFVSIARHPASGSPRYAHELDLPGFRFGQVRGFPYLVFYLEREGHVDVWRVLHEERDIPAWMRGPETE